MINQEKNNINYVQKQRMIFDKFQNTNTPNQKLEKFLSKKIM